MVRFADAALERQFQNHYSKSCMRIDKLSGLMGTVIWLIAAVRSFDESSTPDLVLIWTRVILGALPMLFLWRCPETFFQWRERFMIVLILVSSYVGLVAHDKIFYSVEFDTKDWGEFTRSSTLPSMNSIWLLLLKLLWCHCTGSNLSRVAIMLWTRSNRKGWSCRGVVLVNKWPGLVLTAFAWPLRFDVSSSVRPPNRGTEYMPKLVGIHLAFCLNMTLLTP